MQDDKAPIWPAPPLEIARYALLSAALAVGSLLLLGVYDVALILIPLPALVATSRYGVRTGVLVAGAAVLPPLLLAWPLAPPVLFATVTLGVVQSTMARREAPAGRILALCVGTFVLLTAAALGLVMAARGFDLARIMLDVIASFKAQIAQYPGMTPRQAAQAVKVFKQTYVYLIPGLVVVGACAGGLISFLISQRLLRVRDLPSVSLPKFRDWQIPWYLAWGLLLGLAAVVGARYLPGSASTAASVVGSNLVVAFGTLFTVQGFAIVFSLFDHFKLPPLTRGLALAVAVMLQFFVAALTVIGLLDVWFNYRKLKRED